MGLSRVVYQNWIVDLGVDPDKRSELGGEEVWPETSGPAAVSNGFLSGGDDERGRQIRQAVRESLKRLDDQEREFVVHFYFMGESYQSLSDRSGRAVHKLEAIHRRAIRKLRRHLAWLVDELFGLSISASTPCPVCKSPHRPELDRLIAGRDRRQTWRPVLKELRLRFGMSIRSPQVLIGHEKYHMKTTANDHSQGKGETNERSE
ncbi:MAG: sigma-70 family RNA polymerase sigma factor [bacterium]